MRLSEAETKRAICLQKRLKFLRWWDKVGRVFCWPWNFYKNRQEVWLKELTGYYNKLQAPEPQPKQPSYHGKGDDFINKFRAAHMGDPVVNVQSKEALFRLLKQMEKCGKGVASCIHPRKS